jgi:MFS transporter, OPA family, sugar phosphate sensor protein UhpC
MKAKEEILAKPKRKSFFGFFKPAPYQKEIEDQKKVDKSYKYWRLRIFYGMYAGYVFYYFTRKSFTFAMPALSSSLGFDKADLGMLGSILSITYGLSKFFSGILGDKSNPRYFMSIGLILTGLFNIFFGLSSSLFLFALFWGLNGWFQGWGWPGCAKLLTHWYSQSERGTWWSLWNTSHNLGAFIIPILVSFCAHYYGWRASMILPGVLSICVGLFIIDRLRDTPRSLGLPTIEKFRNDYSSSHNGKFEEKEELTVKEILFNFVLKNWYIWILAFSYFFVYVVRTAVNDWSMFYLVEMKGYNYTTAGVCVSSFEIGGLCGSLLAGWSSDKIFKGRRAPVNILYSLLCVVGLVGMWNYSAHSVFLDSFFIFFIGFAIFGPQMLIGIAAAELSHKKAAATATGFAGFFGYLGAACAGWPLGKILNVGGWSGYYITLAVCAICASLLLIPLWSVKASKEKSAVSS